MSKLFVFSKNIPIENLEHYYPPDVQFLWEDNITMEICGDNQVLLSLSLAEIKLNKCQLIPTLSIATKNTYGYKCFFRRYNNNSSNRFKEVTLVSVGSYPDPTDTAHPGSRGIKTDSDSFLIKEISNPARIVFKIIAADIAKIVKQPLLLSISVAPALTIRNVPLFKVDTGHDIDVPAKSQMEFNQNIQKRICSPTCLSMVLDYYGKKTKVLKLAERAYHQGCDLYGIWPSNIWAASQFLCLGYIHRFSSFNDAKKLLDNDIPLITSIRYKAGDLTHGAVNKTLGHLVVFRGYYKGEVIVNDPAAPDSGTVTRSYNMDEFLRAWLGNKGVAYVLIPIPE